MMLTDQPYGSAGSAALRYDAILAEGNKVPAIVCIHGGGWVSGESSDMHDVAEYFSEKGFAAFCPQYRLAPLYPYPAAIQDIEHMLLFLRENADQLNILPDSIGVIGNSAGGHLSAMAGLSVNEAARANAVVDICGLTDLTNVKENHPPISWDFISQFMAGAPTEDPRWIEASPIYRIVEGAPPFMIFHGEEDDVVYVDQSIRFHRALFDAGVDAKIELLPGEGHSFTFTGFGNILEESTDFFRQHLAAGVA